MAKDISLDDDYDFDIDSELDQLDNMNFGETEPPKNAREATLRVAKDGARGAAEAFKFNKENVGNVIDAAMPSSLRGEYLAINNALFGKDGIKDAIDQGLKNVKSETRQLTQSISNLLPKDGKLGKLLEKINSKLSDEEDLSKQLEANNAMLLQGFQEELSKTFTKESSLALMQADLQQKQFKSTLEVQNSINNHLSVVRNFHLEVTNSFYRKSLELQYRTLMSNELQAKALTEGFALLKQQNEAIIKNTGLPEFVKIRTSEQFKQVMLGNAATNIQNFMFKDISAIDKIKTSLSNRIKYGFENFIEGLQTVGAVTDAAEMMNGLQDMGISKSFLVGNKVGEYFRDTFAKKYVSKAANSRIGKPIIFGVKNALADPSGWASDRLNKLTSREGFGDPNASFLQRGSDYLLEGFYRNLRDIASVGGDYVGATFSRSNPNDVATFNNATQTSIVKIIPGLLSKIYGEVKTIRSGGGDPEGYELVYDYNRQRFSTRSEFKQNFIGDTEARLKSYTRFSLQDLLSKYEENGDFTKDELSVLGNSLISYVITSNSRLNPTVLVSQDFLNHVPDNLKSKVLSAGRKLLAKAIDKPMLVNSIATALTNIRSKIPDMTTEMEMMYSTGQASMLEDMGLLVRDKVDHTFSIHRGNTLDMIRGKLGKGNSHIRSAVDEDNEMISANPFKNMKMEMPDKLKFKILYKEDGSMKSMDDLKEEFFNSAERLQGKVKSFPEWLEQTVGRENLDKVLKYIPSKDSKTIRKMKIWTQKQLRDRKILGKTYQDLEDQITDIILNTGNKKSLAELRTEFMKSPERLQGYVKDFPEWLRQTMTKERLQKVLKDMPAESKEAIDKLNKFAKEKWKEREQLGKAYQEFEDKVMDTVTGIDYQKTLSDLRTEFMKSPERLQGYVKDFPEWLSAQGLGSDGRKQKSSSRMWRLLQFTWSIDRAIAKAMFKYPWRATKFGLKTIRKGLWEGDKFGVPKLLKGAGYTASALPLNMYYLMKEAITGKPVNGGLPTFGLDRFFTKTAFKTPKALGKLSKQTGKMLGGILRGMKRPYDWLFKAGTDAGVSQDTQAILAGLDEMNSHMSEINANTPKKSFLDPDGDGLRKGDWRTRLKSFTQGSSKDGTDPVKGKGIINFMKEHKGLTLMGGLTLAVGLLKGLNISSEEMVNGIKAVGTGVGKLFNGIKWLGEKVGGVFKSVGGFFGFGDDEEEGTDSESSAGYNVAGTAAVAGAGLFAARHPIKTTKAVASVGQSLVSTIIKMCKSKFGLGWIGDILKKNESQIVSKADKTIKGFDNFKRYLSKLGKVIRNPKFIQRIGTKTAAKAGAKITTAIASSATGIGGLLTAGLVLWEIGWALYYMWDKDITFWQGLMYQLFGTTLTDEEIDSYANDGNGIKTSETGNLYKTIKNKDGDEIRLEVDHKGNPFVSTVNGEREKYTFSRRNLKSDLDSYGIDYKDYYDLKKAAAEKNNAILKDSGGAMSNKDLAKKWKGSGASTRAGDVAASYTNKTKSSGKCATGVRTILERAGYPSPSKLGFDVGSAYMYAKPQISGMTPLEGMGYSQLNVDPVNFKPQDGDVAVIDKGPMSNAKHGHIAIWSDKIRSWVSDFIQPDKTDPSPYGAKGLKARMNPSSYRDYVTFWRDMGNGGMKNINSSQGGSEKMPDQVPDTSAMAKNDSSTTEGMGGDYSAEEATPMQAIKITQERTDIRSAQSYNTDAGVKELTVISQTLVKSLQVQMHMAAALDKIANDRSLGIDPNTIGGNKGLNGNTQSESIPPAVIDLKRNQYTMPI